MDQPQRLLHIDILRGMAMVVIIIIHSAAYFLNNKFIFFVWNSLQFAVVTFIFCSAYLFLKKSSIQKLSPIIYFFKRVRRLLIPYWIYLVVLFILMWFKGEVLSPELILRYVTLTTQSNDLSWLVVLMLMLTPITLFVSRVKNYKSIYISFTLISLILSLTFLFYTPNINFKFIMWLPWSLIIIATDYFVTHEHRASFFPKFLTASLVVFVIALLLRASTSLSLIQYANKYPPNLLHLSYGLFTTGLLYWSAKKILYHETMRKFFSFFGTYSYSIYFIHFLIIFACINFTPIQQYGFTIFLTILLSSTLTAQIFINHLKKYFSSA